MSLKPLIAGMAQSGGSAGGPPTGAAGGDLDGTYPNPTIPKLSGIPAGGGLLLSSDSFGGLRSSGIDESAVILADTGWAAAASTGDKTDQLENYSGNGVDGAMAAALELVSSGLGTVLQQDEARLRELIHFCQALQTALAAKLRPNV